jgi:hypothetical protein
MTPWATPEAWARVTEQTVIGVIPTVTVGETECIELIPNVGWDEKNVFGFTIPAGQSPVMEVCGQPHDFGLTVLGWNLGGLAAAAGLSGISAALYFMFKNSG